MDKADWNETVGLIDPARPDATTEVFEWLRSGVPQVHRT